MTSSDHARSTPLRHAVLAVLLGAVATAWVIFPPRLVIESPTFGGPEILTPGADLRVMVRVAVPWATAVDEATLERGPVHIPLIRSGPAQSGARQEHVYKVPAGCPPGNYDLVARAGRHESRSRRAVSVVSAIPERFTLAQITDLHVGYTAAGEASLNRIVDEVNRLAPALVLISGDITHDGRWDQVERAQHVLERLTMPFVCVPGNHDRRGWGAYLSRFGFPYRVVAFGRWTILGLDCGHGRDQFTESQLAFIVRAVEAAEPGRVLAFAHIPLAGARSVKTNAETAMELFRRMRVPLVLSGHLHYGRTYGETATAGGPPGTRFVVTATAGGWLVKGPAGQPDPRGFCLVTVEDGRITSVEPRHLGEDGGVGEAGP